LTDVLRQVRQAVRTHDLIPPGEDVVVGVSGGPDSLCLLHALYQLRETMDLDLHVAHLDHAARGAASEQDAQFVQSVAEAWGLPVTVERRDIPALADEHGLAFEETARRVRYAFMDRVAQRVGASRIAVGHNADDQAETVLMHIVRGSGLSGLRGMLPLTPLRSYRLLGPFEEGPQPGRGTNGQGNANGLGEAREAGSTSCLIRPLLGVSRRDIEDYCEEHA
jgi:tRNA(Ile)-lysidine synthase